MGIRKMKETDVSEMRNEQDLPQLITSENLQAMTVEEGSSRTMRPGKTRQLEFITQIGRKENNTENPRDLLKFFLENSTVLISVRLSSRSWKEQTISKQ